MPVANKKSITAVRPEKMEVIAVSSEREILSFHQAARYGNVPIIQKYLFKFRGRRKKINKLDKQELSALHYAVRHGHLEVITLLVQAKADVNIAGADGAQPIHIAAKYFKTTKYSRDDSTSTSHVITEVLSTDNQYDNIIYEMDEENIDVGEEAKPLQAEGGGLNVISYLLEHGADINALDYYDQSPLHYATCKGNTEAMTLLLNWPGINIEHKDTAGGSAVHTACGNGHKDALRLLLMHGAKLMIWDNENMNPLHHAATTDEGGVILKELVNIIEKCGGELEGWKLFDMMNDQDNQGQSLLHLAVDLGHYEVCKLALEKGARVNHCRNGFITPLHLAATTGNLEIAKLLVSHGANIEAQNVLLETPLHKAANFNRVEIIEYLLEQGCSVNCYDQDNTTPLIMAAANGSKEAVETVQVLLNHNADMSILDSSEKSAIFWAAESNAANALKLLLESLKKNDISSNLIEETDRFENTPLHIASKKGYKHIVQLLINHNADVDSCNDEELTPLHLAVINGNKKVATTLLTKQPDIINDEDESGNTALHLAALNGHAKLIELLIEFGAGVEPRNTVLWTPLDCAAANGHTDCVIQLLDNDAPIDPMDLASTTPLHLASRAGHADVVRVLLSNGADLSLLDHAGKNALDMAVENSHRNVALVILNHKDWLLAARNRSRDGKGITTPMRQLIKKLPDVAYEMLNKCMKLSENLPYDSYDYSVTFFYDLIDDTYANWSNDYEEEDLRTVSSKDPESDANYLSDFVQKIMERKENHPLLIMSQYKRDKLLNHPLVLSLIYDKWEKFGRIVFYSKFSLYFLFLFFFTAFVLVATPLLPREVKKDGKIVCNSTAEEADKNRPVIIAFYIVGRIVMLILSFLQLFLEILQLISRRMVYMRDFNNWIEWIIYILAIFYVWPEFDNLISGQLGALNCSAHISIGAVAIFLAWINLLLFIQKFPTLGIYVVMFVDVLKTFLKFSITFIMFIVAFALGFYTLLQDKFEVTYKNIWRTILKTTVMMIGEFDFDDLFNNGDTHPPFFTWILFTVFIIVMTILLMNLMVGLAVDDIKLVLDQAVLTRVAMQVHLVIDVEKMLPRSFRKKYISHEKVVYPNRDFKWLISHITRMEEIQEAIKPRKTVSDIVQEHTQSIRETVDKIKSSTKTTGKQIKNLQLMMDKLLKHANIQDDTDDDD